MNSHFSVEKVSTTSTLVTLGGGAQILIIGTAHVSESSAVEVLGAFDSFHPDSVCIELDSERWNKATNPKSASDIDVVSAFKKGKAMMLAASLIMSNYQKKLSIGRSERVGGEIIGAGEESERRGIPLTFCDRTLAETLSLAWHSSSFFEKVRLLGALIDMGFSRDEASDEEIESLKAEGQIQTALAEVAKEFPNFKRVLVDQRDEVLSRNIFFAPGQRKLAVVGAGHREGIVGYLKRLQEGDATVGVFPENEKLMKKSGKASNVVAWTVTLLFCAVFLAIGAKKGWQMGLKSFGLWAAVNSSCSALAAAITLSHPWTVVVTFFTSAIAALSPVLGVGIFAGTAEVTRRHPKLSDLENAVEDASKVRKWFSNRVLHPLTIFFATSAASIVGSFVVFPVLVSKFL